MATEIPTFKLVLVGDGGTGKASQLSRQHKNPEACPTLQPYIPTATNLSSEEPNLSRRSSRASYLWESSVI
jgi:GTPase SAR1 family protein